MGTATVTGTPTVTDSTKVYPAYFCCPHCSDEVFVAHNEDVKEYFCNRCNIKWPFAPLTADRHARELILSKVATFYTK